LTRKGFAFNADKLGMMKQQADLFKSDLKTADVTFQNLDSSNISITDVSHYYNRNNFSPTIYPREQIGFNLKIPVVNMLKIMQLVTRTKQD
jgi:hypothetical protein